MSGVGVGVGVGVVGGGGFSLTSCEHEANFSFR